MYSQLTTKAFRKEYKPLYGMRASVTYISTEKSRKQ